MILLIANDIYRHSYIRDGGFIPVPDAPGIGVELNADAMSKSFTPMNTGSTPISEDGSIAYAV